MPPSSCELSTRNCIGHSGHGVCGARVIGRLRQHLELRDVRRLLAMRSAQAIRARIAAADDDDALAGGQNLIRAPCRLRRPCSTAAGNPSRSGCPSVRGPEPSDRAAARRPPASRIASKSRRRSLTGMLLPTCALTTNSTPSRRICSMRRSIRCFSILKFGMP